MKDFRLKNRITGVSGIFVKEFTNNYGDAIMIRTDDGREYYAPKHEWVIISNSGAR